MNYIDIVQLVFMILFLVFGLMMAHFIFFAIVGIFAKKTYPETDKKNRYGIIIPARNEESVVAGLIESVRKNNYPQDKLDVYVISHNCTDKTADVARKAGAIVYEYTNDKENTMGYAFKHLFECIERDYGTQQYDGFFLFNADNILDSNFFTKMNDAFEFYDKKYVITSFRNSKNFGSNLISGLYGLYFAVGCRFESRGRTVLGCSTRVQGTGYVINSNIIKDGWPYVTLTEDWEFTADQVLLNNKVRYCDEAVFYDEQPTDVKIMWRQRVRWSRGHLLVFYARAKDIIKALFSKESKYKVSIYDNMMNTLPSILMWLIMYIIEIVLLLIAPLVDPSITLYDVFIGKSTNFFTSNGLLFIWARMWIISTFFTLASAVTVFIIERKRIKNVSLGHKVLITLMWPIFLMIQFPMDVQAFFSKNLGWKPIPHKDQTSFENVNGEEDSGELPENSTEEEAVPAE